MMSAAEKVQITDKIIDLGILIANYRTVIKDLENSDGGKRSSMRARVDYLETQKTALERSINIDVPKTASRTGNPHHDFPNFGVTYMAQFNGGSEQLFICRCGVLCTGQSIYTHVNYHIARGEAVV